MTNDFADFRQALTEALDSRGVTDKVAASLRAEMYSLLAARDAPPAPTPGESSNETRLINSLILEYLDYTLLTHTRSVLALETGTQQPLSRGEMRRETGVEGDPRLPLLYTLCLQKRPEDPARAEEEEGLWERGS